MNMKTIAVGALVLAAALGAGRWGWNRVEAKRAADPLGVRLTLDYQGTVSGLFKAIEEKSGARYDLDPKVAGRKLGISVKNASVTQIQEEAAKKSALRYRPLDLSGKIVKVEPK